MNKQGLISGWNFLKEIKATLNAKALAITIGNHDVDSRNMHEKGPFELIKSLDDHIPSENIIANSMFWKNNYCIIEDEKHILLIINSCYNHTSVELLKNTEIDQSTIDKIEADIIKIKDSEKIKMALCHHHPLHHSNGNLIYRDTDFIDKSDKLLSILEKNNFNLVIHGHKHDPRLVYFNSSLPVLAAGSFSALTNLLDIGAQNTFHIIDFDLKTKKGKIITWVYYPSSGWTQKLDTYFPCFTGFGCKIDMIDFAKKCSEWFDTTKKETIEYSELLTIFPDLEHLIPSEQEKFNDEMKSKYNLYFTPPLPNKPNKVYKIE